MYNLLDRKWRGRLLTVAEGGIRYPDLLGHAGRYKAVVERNLRHAFIIEKVAVEVRLLAILELIFICRLLEQICRVGECKRLRHFVLILHEKTPFLSPRFADVC